MGNNSVLLRIQEAPRLIIGSKADCPDISRGFLQSL